MAAYLIADINVTDPAAFEEYKRQVGPQTMASGGRYLVRGGGHEVLEGDWQPGRLVVIEFADMAALKAWYASPEYQALKTIRQRASTGRLIAVEGSSP